MSEDRCISDDDINERLLLASARLKELKDGQPDMPHLSSALIEYFRKTAGFLCYVYEVYGDIISGRTRDMTKDELEKINYNLYADILGDNYEKSFANPDYAAKMLGGEYGGLLCFLAAETRSAIAYAYDIRPLCLVSVMELFLEVFGEFTEELPKPDYVKKTIYYYMFDYADVLVSGRCAETICPMDGAAVNIIMDSDLSDLRYLYGYGEYIGDNELKTAKYMNSMSEDEINAIAATYVDGFVRGYKTMRIDLSPKKAVNIRYHIGQERMIRSAINMFKEYGIEPIIFRYAVSRINRRLTTRTGYEGTPANRQYEYDHRMDEALFMDKAFIERKLAVLADTYEKHKKEAYEYAGPAVIETFGETPFTPAIKESALTLDKRQQELSLDYSGRAAELANVYMPRDKYSFTIIAYPIPEIGDDFERIFEDTVRVNTLDNDRYKCIQQRIIDVLDDAAYVHVLGTGGNKTDIRVMLHRIDRLKETNFENCLANVNIPLGEVFTSPVLTGTDGTLNVSSVYLNGLKYENLTLGFKDGRIKEYSCDNFDDAEKNRAFIKENLMLGHDTLPIGEFAIGTNTEAYVMARRYDILYKLPILIVEKTGPHFAVGDTCYSYSEDAVLYNPDGREIIAKENECSAKRRSADETERKSAYFNCHTDITIPYEEIGGIYAVTEDGRKTAIIENGRFVLDGTEELNIPFDMTYKLAKEV